MYRFPAVDVFPDGASLTNVLDAIRVAWIADPRAAAEIAERYGMGDICLRCTAHKTADSVTTGFSSVTTGFSQKGLCALCFWKEVDAALPNPSR